MTIKILCLNTTMQYSKEAVTIFHNFVTISRCHYFSVICLNCKTDHEKLCVHIRNMHRYLHRVRKEIDNELAKTYRKSELRKNYISVSINLVFKISWINLNWGLQKFNLGSRILMFTFSSGIAAVDALIESVPRVVYSTNEELDNSFFMGTKDHKSNK